MPQVQPQQNPGGQGGPNNGAGKQVQVSMTDEVLRGVYANNLSVGYSREEFVLDFMNLFPPKGLVGARVFVSPGHLKRVIGVLTNSLKQYEDKFGKIEEASQPLAPEIGFTDRK